MRKFLTITLLILLVATTFLAACDSTDTPDASSAADSSAEASVEPSAEPSEEPSVAESSEDESVDSSAVAESSEETESSAAMESSEPVESSEPAESSESEESEESVEELTVYTCRYTEDPYFVIVGQCEDGATVSGKTDTGTVSSKSYKGWFSLRVKTNADPTVTITQTVDGKQVGKTLSYKSAPEYPARDMWPMIAGKNFQFFLAKSSDDFEGTNIPADTTFSMLKTRIKGRLNQLHKTLPDTEIIYMVVPSAMTVYPELVPSEYKPASVTKMDKTLDALREAGATVIDLESAFKKHKNDSKPIYFKTDSHWSEYGAYVAYTELFNYISQRFPDAKPRQESEFNWNPDYYQGGDMAYYLAANYKETTVFQQDIREYSYYRTFKFPAPSVITSVQRYYAADKLSYSNKVTPENYIYTYRDNLPSCIVMRDSFSTQIYDILAERCDTTHYYPMWGYAWNIAKIRSEAPDYIIYIVSEWNIDDILSN